ncbi:MAG: DEAD/DEAH box helicase family protein, partial [Thermoguttaceae bacterium]|nr:DEAD/DEAH box helicase family protein [Thermoguttaceae bacterium]
NGLVLYLVPSLMLLAQTLKEWSRESRRTIAPIVVCSDSQAHERDVRAAQALAPKKSRKKSDLEIDDDEPTFDAEELTRPATTKPDVVVQRWRELQALREKSDRERLTVVFSTYQSLQVLIDAQNVGAELDGELCKLPTFDLVVCDEAHRTTGVTLTKGKDESAFVKVHDDAVLSAKKRLYMTATPRVYGDAAQLKAKDKDAVLCSMDDEAIYGAEFHRLGFGDAVEKDLLADYKVLIFAISDVDAAQQFARYRTMSEVAETGAIGEEVDKNDVNVGDVAKMIGCWRGLSKIGSGLARGSDDFASDPAPMKRAVAFCRSIKESKEFAKAFKIVSDGLVKDAKEESARRSLERIEGAEARERFAASLGETRTPGAKETESTREGVAGGERDDAPLRLELRHVDGGFSGNEREKALEWLRGEEPGTCRILSNVRCLSEGVDVPTLDAALFIAPRNSQVDVIQAVGRVMRKAPGKKFGYVILPIVVSADVAPEVALDDNERYRVVWQTLNALRAHDERFRIMINQLQVGEKPDRIVAIPPTSEPTEEPEAPTDTPPRQQPLAFAQSDFDRGLYAQIVKRCGDRNYLDQWAKEVAELTATRMDFIRKQLEHKTPEQEAAFDE